MQPLPQWSAPATGTAFQGQAQETFPPIDFRTDGTFDLYQRVYSPYYEHFDGTWTLDGNTLDGNYSDGTPWRSSYTVSVNEDASGLTLTDTFDSEDVSRFIRAAIPEDILSGILGTKGTMETSSGKGFL